MSEFTLKHIYPWWRRDSGLEVLYCIVTTLSKTEEIFHFLVNLSAFRLQFLPTKEYRQNIFTLVFMVLYNTLIVFCILPLINLFDRTTHKPNTTTTKTMTLVNIVLSIFAFPTAFWLVLYLLPQVYMVLRPVPDLKQRYNATWALVTGAGSGIGEFIAHPVLIAVHTAVVVFNYCL